MTVIPFFTLSNEILQSIAKMKLAKVGRRLTATHGMAFNVDEPVYAMMAKRCNQVDLGARQVDHLIERTVLPEMSRQLLEQMSGERMPKSVTLGVDQAGEDFTYAFSD
jgi:type VI secretion system protein VasG